MPTLAKPKRPSLSLIGFVWVLLIVACAAQVATVNAKTGHLKIQENGVDIIPTGAGTSGNPWVFNTTSGSGGLGPFTDNRILRADGTSGIQDSLWEITDAGHLFSTTTGQNIDAGNGSIVTDGPIATNTGGFVWNKNTVPTTWKMSPAITGGTLSIDPEMPGAARRVWISTGTASVVFRALELADLPSGIPPGGSAGGVLTGSYPNPGLATGAVAFANLGTATNPGLEDSSGIRVKVASPLTLGASGVGIQDASTSQKGAAQFSSTFFTVSSGTASIANAAIGNSQLATGLAPQFATTTQTNTNYTVQATDHLVLVSTGNSTRTITLPLAANNIGRRIVIMKTDTGTGSITIARTSSDVINVRGNWGATSQTITNVQGAGAELIGQASGAWLVINTI